MPKQDWIRATLKDRGYKLKDVGAALDIPPPRVTDILNGKREVQADEVERLADLLGLSPRSLLRSLEDGKRTIAPGDDGAPRVPVRGVLYGDGRLDALPDDFPFTDIAPPPNAATAEGLACYVMGDASMGALVGKGCLAVTADPRHHFVPIVPGQVFVLGLSDGRQVMRQYVKTAGGQDMLRGGEGADEPTESFSFSLLPDALAGAGKGRLGIGDIIGAVMWLHTPMLKAAD